MQAGRVATLRETPKDTCLRKRPKYVVFGRFLGVIRKEEEELDKRMGGDIMLAESSAPKLCLLESIGYPLMLPNERKSWLRIFLVFETHCP